MAYTVPNVPLIPQTLSLACWYASAQMLVQWRRGARQMTEAGRPDPSEVPAAVATQAANNGLALNQMVKFARLMGLRTVPPMTPTVGAIESWLKSYGPIWTAGLKVSPHGNYGHVIVIAGVAGDRLFIHDPEPINMGSSVWKPASWLVTTLSLQPNVIPTNFMHY